MSKLILITGGVRSGKSNYAQGLARSLKTKVVYIATAAPLDSEMKRRIKLHRKGRDKSWSTVEEPIGVLRAIKKLPAQKTVILLDCLTLLISNLMFKGLKDNEIYKEIKSIAQTLKRKAVLSIVVTNEVGSGIVPDNELARRFRDLQGRANQILSEAADCVYFLVSGIPIKIKGGDEDV